MGKFVGYFLVLFIFLNPVLGYGKVALHIYFNDGFAFAQNSEDLFERIFSELRPDLTYRRISIPANRLKGKAGLADLKEQISSSLEPGEEMAVLIIDTHGGTEKSVWGRPVTSLRHIGKVHEAEVDSDFKETFDSLKDRAAKDLQIILNSCSVFCGGVDSAALRAGAILDFFRASDGSIYGSNVAEVSHALDHKEFFKWKYLLPDIKMVLTVAGVTSALMFPVMGYEEFVVEQGSSVIQAFLAATKKSVAIGLGASGLASVLNPAFQFISSRYFLNKGYYFSFKDGKLLRSFDIKKQRDLKNIVLNDLSKFNCSALLLN